MLFCVLMRWLVAGGSWITLEWELVAKATNDVIRVLEHPVPPSDLLGGEMG